MAVLNSEETRLTGKRPKDAIKAMRVTQKPSLPTDRPVGLQEQKLPSSISVRYLYQPGELGGGRRHATDPVWSIEVCQLRRSVTKPGEPVLYYLDSDGPERGFVVRSFWWCPPTLSCHRMGFLIEVDLDASILPVGDIPVARLEAGRVSLPVVIEPVEHVPRLGGPNEVKNPKAHHPFDEGLPVDLTKNPCNMAWIACGQPFG